MNRTYIGLDLAQDHSQISFYNERSGEVESASIRKGKENYLIPTPADLFQTALEAKELGAMSLANFIKRCISCIRPLPKNEEICMMVTMREITAPWVAAVKEACEMAGIPAEQVFLQSYKDSLQNYILNQKTDIWSQASVVFEYVNQEIRSQIMKVSRSTKPAIVTITEGPAAKLGEQGEFSAEQWNQKRDILFLELIRTIFAEEKVSSCYLIGDGFDKEWPEKSIELLCKKRHVYLGSNLYTKGACYGALRRMNVGKKLDGYLFRSDDLVEMNLSMQLDIRGSETKYTLISAGKNWYDSSHSFEAIVNQEKTLVFTMKSMMGGDPVNYSLTLKGLPERPGRTTRVTILAKYQDPKHCKITVKDLGFGELFPSTNRTWTSVLTVE